MSPLRAVRCVAALLVLLAPAAQAEQQYVYPSDAVFTRAGSFYYYDGCYRHGRCSVDDLRRLRDRLQRLERVTPQAPEAEPAQPMLPRGDVPPTPEEQIQPAYRHASQLREEYRRGDAPAR